MALQRSSRVGFLLVASALVLLSNFAAHAHARHHHKVRATHFVPGNAVQGAQKFQQHDAPNPDAAPEKVNDGKQPGRNSVGGEQGGNGGPAGNANTSTETKEVKLPDMKDLGPVDTHITVVQPRFEAGKTELTRLGGSKIKSKSGKYFHVRPAFTRHKSNPVVRNTIGVPVAPQSITAGQHGVPAGAPAFAKAGADKGLGGAGPAVSPAGTFHPVAGVGGSGPFANHGAISGSGFPRRGFVPATLGGQTKMTGALSGSMIRPKY